jgi:hypothetical protein
MKMVRSGLFICLICFVLAVGIYAEINPGEKLSIVYDAGLSGKYEPCG